MVWATHPLRNILARKRSIPGSGSSTGGNARPLLRSAGMQVAIYGTYISAKKHDVFLLTAVP
jgi:hypothetical protein